MSSYIETVLAPALADFTAKGTLPNVFARFGLTPDADDATVREATDRVVSEWQKLKSNIKYKALIVRLLEDKDRALAILLDPARRAAERKALADRANAELAKLDDDIRSAGAKGYVRQAKLASLVEDWRGTATADEVRARVAALGFLVQRSVEEIAGAPRESAQRFTDYGEIKRQLAVLEEPSFYTFLGMAPDAAHDVILGAIANAQQRWLAAAVDHRKTAAQALLRLTDAVLYGPYRAARTWEIADALTRRVTILEQAGVISYTEVQSLGVWAREAGYGDLTPPLLHELLVAVAGEHPTQLSIELRAKGAPRPPTPVQRPVPTAPAPQVGNWDPFTAYDPRKDVDAFCDEIRPATAPAPSPTASPKSAKGFSAGAFAKAFFTKGVKTPGDFVMRIVVAFVAVSVVMMVAGVLLGFVFQIASLAAMGWGIVWLAANGVSALGYSRWLAQKTTEAEFAELALIGPVPYAAATQHPVLAPVIPAPRQFAVQAGIVATASLIAIHFVYSLFVPTHSMLAAIAGSAVMGAGGAAAWAKWSLPKFNVTRTLPMVGKLHLSRVRTAKAA